MALAIDGTAHGTSSTTTCTATLTTSSTNDYIIACVFAQNAVIGVSGSTLGAFTQIGVEINGSDLSYIFAIFSSGALTSEVVTATSTSSPAILTVDAFGVSGSGQTSLVFDSGGPVTGAACPVSFTNASANVMLVASIGWFIANPGAGTGFTQLPGSGGDALVTEYDVLSATATTSVTTGNDGLTNAVVAVGIVQASGGATVTWFGGARDFGYDALLPHIWEQVPYR